MAKTLLAVGTLLTLTACQQDFTLLDSDKAVVGTVNLEVEANFPSPAHVQFNGKEFSGTWNATKIYEESLAKKYRLLGSKAYGNYMVGNARDQLYRGSAVLNAEDGTEMICTFYHRGQLKSGQCSVDGKVLTLTLGEVIKSTAD